MNDLDWGTIRRIFEAALELPTTQQRAYVTDACGNDTALRYEVEKMLEAEAKAGDFIERPAIANDLTATAPLPDFIGRRVGPYEIQSKLGAGGMGAVYLAERVDNVFKKKVAVKILQPGTSTRDLQRFFQERQILAELDHPNIARILDGGSLDDLPYVIMEYVPGTTLRTMLNSHGPLPLAQIVKMTKQICAGLHFAHAKGIIHRDIKPDNIMVQEGDGFIQVKILDFGIAKLIEAEEFAYKTSTGLIFGTPKYMSPDQIQATQSHQLDARSDIYSLGMVVYEMLTGQVAFNEPTWMQIAYCHVNTTPTAPSTLRPDLNIPAKVERVVLRALEKDRANRPSSALAFTQELQAAVPPHPTSTKIPAPIQSTQETVAYDATTVARQPKVIPIAAVATMPMQAARRPKKYHAVAIAFLLMALGAGGFIYYQFKPSDLSQLQKYTSKNSLTAEAQAAQPNALRYQVLLEKDNTLTPIPENKELHSDEKIRFQMLPPFKGSAYLFYEETPKNDLYWINSVNLEVQQIRGIEKTLIPLEQPITLDKVATRTKVRFLLVCVPSEVGWSLEKLVEGDLKLYGLEGHGTAAIISQNDKVRLLDSLRLNGISVPFILTQQGDAWITQIPLLDQKRVIYQWIEFYQLP